MPYKPSAHREVLRFGKYEVLGKIGSGGMAEVFKCRQSGIGGFDKVVVVKRLLPELLEDRDLVNSFLDEARIAAKLSHPNIVQIYEIDQVGDAPYIAMEYARGPTLSKLIHEAWRQGKPCERIVAKVLSDIACALAHAHGAADEKGRPYNIVHRDVTPHNIVVTVEGIKGKFRYMAPEQLQDDKSSVDGRADVFAVGVCLYLAATGRHAYAANDEIAVLKAASMGAFPRPVEVNPDIDPELESIILWAMDPSLDRRCPSAVALQERLDAYVSKGDERVTNQQVAQYLKLLFGDLNKSDQLVWSAYSDDHISSKRFSAPVAGEGADGAPLEIELDDMVSASQSGALGGALRGRGSAGGPSRRLIAVGAISVVLLGALAGVLWNPLSSQATDKPEVTVAAPSPAPQPIEEKAPPAPPVELTKVDVPTPPEVAGGRDLQVGPKQGRLSVVTDTPARVLIDGRFEGMSPLKLKLSADTHTVGVQARGYPSQQKVVALGADVDAQLTFRLGKRGAVAPALRREAAATAAAPTRDVSSSAPPTPAVVPQPSPEPVAPPPPQEPEGDGWLTLRTEPWCDVYVHGERVGTTPINHLVFPAGKHSLRLVNESAKIEKTLQVEIRPGQESTARLMLEQ